MEENAPRIHEHLNKALAVLDGLKFQGYHEISAIAPAVGLAMTELIKLEQEAVEYEQSLKAKPTEELNDEQQT